MTLAQASSYFDRTPVLDPDNAKVLFYGQVDPYDDSRRDAVGAYRRILSVAPGTRMPASRVVSIHGVTWIIGAAEIDGLADAHRAKYVLQPVEGKYSLSTVSSYLQGAADRTLWLDIEWLKDVKEEEASSRSVPTHTIYAAKGVTLGENDVVWASGAAYLVQTSRLLASQVLSATALKLEYPVASATLRSRTYDPAAGEFTAGAATSVNCLRVRWQSLYRYDSQSDQRYQEGDASLVLPAGTTLAMQDELELAGQLWTPLSVDAMAGAVVVHGRPA